MFNAGKRSRGAFLTLVMDTMHGGRWGCRKKTQGHLLDTSYKSPCFQYSSGGSSRPRQCKPSSPSANLRTNILVVSCNTITLFKYSGQNEIKTQAGLHYVSNHSSCFQRMPRVLVLLEKLVLFSLFASVPPKNVA